MTSATVAPFASTRRSVPGNSATSERGRWTIAGAAPRVPVASAVDPPVVASDGAPSANDGGLDRPDRRQVVGDAATTCGPRPRCRTAGPVLVPK